MSAFLAEKNSENEAEGKAEKEISECNGAEKTTTAEDGEKKADSDEKKADGDEKKADSDEKKADSDKKKADSDDTDDNKSHSKNSTGPSPNKRAKLDDKDKRRRSKTEVVSEDEFEEIVPVPREAMSLLPDYELVALIAEEKYIAGPQRPESRKACEVIILVGLPGSGKTHWTLNHLAENADKRYHVVGADDLIAKMTVCIVSFAIFYLV